MPVLLSGSPREPWSNDCVLCTRSGERIPHASEEDLDSVLSREKSIEATRLFLDKFRGGLKVRSVPHFPYNCVGMVFGSRRVWIDIDYIPHILRGDNYRRIDRHAADIGDVIVYIYDNLPAHVGIIFGKELEIDGITARFRVLSKWGGAAEFEHFEDIVPEVFGQQREFYTERSPM